MPANGRGYVIVPWRVSVMPGKSIPVASTRFFKSWPRERTYFFVTFLGLGNVTSIWESKSLLWRSWHTWYIYLHLVDFDGIKVIQTLSTSEKPQHNHQRSSKPERYLTWNTFWRFIISCMFLVYFVIHMSHEKNHLTFHYTGCLIRILIMVYYSPHNWVV